MKAKFLATFPFKLMILIVLAGVLYLGGHFFVTTSKINQAWMKQVQIPSTTAFDSTAFHSLIEGGAIWPIRDGISVTLGHASCNTLALRSPETVKLVDGVAGENGRQYIRELCESPQGERIREELANFNQSYRIVAVSDNREAAPAKQSSKGALCADGVSTALLFVPKRCLPNKWEATIATDGRAVQSITTATISQTDYAFLASETESFFGDWKVITPVIDAQTGDAGLYTFKTTMTFGDLPISIRTIGPVRTLKLDGKTVEIDPNTDAESVHKDAGRAVKVALAIYCANDAAGIGKRARCEAESPKGRPTGTWIYLAEPTGKTVEVEMVLEPSIRVTRGLRRFLANQDNDDQRNDQSDETKKVTLGFGRIRVSCELSRFEVGKYDKGMADTGCDLAWNVPNSQLVERQSEPVTDLNLNDVTILDSRGTLTQKAFEMGLGGLLGLGINDSGSVAAALTETADGENPALTLIPDYQEKALAALAANYTCPKDKEECGRRADLVIIDAEGDDAGNVLAVASLPHPRTGMAAWDIETLERSSPSQSPLAAYAWRNYDLRATPGSAFKLVTALTASQHVLDTDDKLLERILLGQAAPLEMADAFGVAATKPAFNGRCKPNYDDRDPAKMNALPIPGARGRIVFCIGNSASRAGVRSGMNSILEMGVDSGCGDVRAPRAGMCEAMKRSSNLFFAGIAMYLDADKFLDPDTGFEHTRLIDNLLLAKTADRLFPSKVSSDLMQHKTAFDILDPNYPSTGRGRSSPLVVEAGLPVPNGEPRRLRLARGGIGLSVNASPIAMASVAASIATGKIVRPHMVNAQQRGLTDDPFEGQPVLVTTPDKQYLADSFLDEIRKGMGAVIRNQGGTSRSAFAKIPKELRDSIYAKTGTAPVFSNRDIAEEGRYAAWLVGFVEPNGDLPGIDQRIAFACRVAFSPSFGGSVCGPIVRDFLVSLYEGDT
jgi:cell division protein FtsI/penicillin-binding protein 2